MRLRGKSIFWITMGLSGLWFMLSAYGLCYILSAVAEPSSKFYTGLKFTEQVLVAVGIIQPPFIIWAFVRAFRMRTDGSPVMVIGRAALPLSTVIILALAIFGHKYNERLISEELARQMWTGSITYDCSLESNRLDFDPKSVRSIDLRLTATRRDRQPSKWSVTWPGKRSITAENFDASTGSIGGSQGLKWSDADGGNVAALLSFSDILGPFGTETIWVTLVQGSEADIQEKLDAGLRQDFTCGPNPKSYRASS